ncbi:MAG: DNA cytosine methyltransferase [Chloroflexus sp.]|nr:DNA cytosine methyltransferase [Chloroflexus sp.]
MSLLTFYEFFAGGGLARMGLGPSWHCLFANDIDEKKARVYRRNFAGAPELVVADIRQLSSTSLPGQALLAWASFPCQDLSLAGRGQGIHAERSGTFWAFWRLMSELAAEGRRVPIIVIENVTGLLTADEGRSMRALADALAVAGYRFGAMVIDAAYFVPQSRPRLFIVAVHLEWPLPDRLLSSSPHPVWHPSSVLRTYHQLSPASCEAWLWWRLPLPDQPRLPLSSIIELEPTGVQWHSDEETARLLALMAPTHRERIRRVQDSGIPQIGMVYRRMRVEQGRKVQRAEVRFDGLSGCLRTPAGGSSRQILLFVQGNQVRSRLISVREAARLMGVPDGYWLPDRYNEGYHVMGDAVVVPVVAWLERHLLRPLAGGDNARELQSSREEYYEQQTIDHFL